MEILMNPRTNWLPIEWTYSEHFNVLLVGSLLRLNNILLQSILYILFYKTTKLPFTTKAFFHNSIDT